MTETLNDVPSVDLDELAAEYKAAGATSVTAEHQADGLWTLTATMPAQAA